MTPTVVLCFRHAAKTMEPTDNGEKLNQSSPANMLLFLRYFVTAMEKLVNLLSTQVTNAMEPALEKVLVEGKVGFQESSLPLGHVV